MSLLVFGLLPTAASAQGVCPAHVSACYSTGSPSNLNGYPVIGSGTLANIPANCDIDVATTLTALSPCGVCTTGATCHWTDETPEVTYSCTSTSYTEFNAKFVECCQGYYDGCGGGCCVQAVSTREANTDADSCAFGNPLSSGVLADLDLVEPCGVGTCARDWTCDSDGEIQCSPGAEGAEVCGNDLDEDCDGFGGDDGECDTQCGGFAFEDCFDLRDNDCDGLTDVDDPDCDENCLPSEFDDCTPAYDDPAPPNGPEPKPGPTPTPVPRDCACDSCLAQPVHQLTQQAYVGSHEDVRILSPQGAAFDLAFSRTWDSKRAFADDAEDTRPSPPSVDQQPYPRVLGPGWRSSYDLRLILESTDGSGGPKSLLLDGEQEQERLYYDGAAFAKYPTRTWVTATYGSGIEAMRLPTTWGTATVGVWMVTREDGTILEFYEPAPMTTGTKMHPWGLNVDASIQPEAELRAQKHARLRTIHPQGVTDYRIRLYYEQDSGVDALLPPGACTNVDGGNVCDPSRGLLVAVAAEWRSGSSTWIRGSTIELKYDLLSGTRNVIRLRSILEGTDRDMVLPAPPTNPTMLVEFNYGDDAVVTWRDLLKTVHSCADLANDSSSCATSGTLQQQLASELVHYVWRPTSGTFLMEKVERVRRETSGLFRAPEEYFQWAASPWRVIAHRSPGNKLEAISPVEVAGVTTWKVNDVVKKAVFRGGRVLQQKQQTSSGTVVQLNRSDQSSAIDKRRALGVDAVFAASNDTATLRTFDEDGQVSFEVEVVPVGGAHPSLGTVSTSSGCATYPISAVTAVRRATKHYYTNDLVRRRIASATLTHTVGQPSGALSFPSTALPGWSYTGTSAGRSTPEVTSTTCSGFYYDVDVVDADSDADGDLNEAGDTRPVWNHRSLTTPSFGLISRSSYEIIDAAGRIEQKFSYESRSSAATAFSNVMGRIDYEYFPLTKEVHDRGRLLDVTSYANAGAGTGGVRTMEACEGLHDEFGHLQCSTIQQSPTSLRVIESTAPLASHFRRVTTRRRLSPTGTVFQETYIDRLASGLVLESGTTGGNKLLSFFDSANGDWALELARAEQYANDGEHLVTSDYTLDALGRRAIEEVIDEVTGIVRRRTEFNYATDEEAGRLESVENFVTTSSAVTTSYTYNDVTGARLTTTEPDGDLVTEEYASSGNGRGKVWRVKRDGIIVQEFEYDSDARVTKIWNGSSGSGQLVASYTYAEGGRLFAEILESTTAKRENHDDAPTSSGANRYSFQRQKAFSGTTSTVVRDVGTTYDNIGRPLVVCNMLSSCAPLVSYFYDGKGVYAVAGISVEGTDTLGAARQFSLTSNNQKGRLSYVTHPGGTTFYEYDALGRTTAVAQYENTAPLALPLDGSKLKVTEYTYFAGTGEVATVRYPSGRRVQHRYGAAFGYSEDRRGPGEVFITSDTNGVNSFHRVVGDVKYDVDGSARRWLWGTQITPPREHIIDRDMLGRVKEIKDTFDTTTVRAELEYQNRDGDGDVDIIEDKGPFASVLGGTAGGVPPAKWDFSYDAIRDLPTGVTGTFTNGWTPDALGRRASETIGAVTYTYSYPSGLERVSSRSGSGVANIALNYAATTFTGDVQSIDFPTGGTVEATYAYGQRGELASVTTTSGTWSVWKDHQMNWWGTTNGSITRRLRYDAGNQLVDWTRTAGGGTTSRDEFIYLQGLAVGVTHTDNLNPSPRTWWLSTDAMGVPRRILDRTDAMTQISRLILEPFGKATKFDVAGAYGMPALPFRYPGQLDFIEGGVFDNKWRAYFPDLGVYLSPDPMHRVTALVGPGPQVYAYAGGRPLTATDPTGLYSLDSSWDSNLFAKGIATGAWADIKEDEHCRCTFKAVHGRDPLNDSFSIHYGIESVRADTTGSFGFAPFSALMAGDPEGNLPSGLTLNDRRRIEIGEQLFLQTPLTNLNEQLRDTMAHEITHTSFLVRRHYENGERNPEWMGRHCRGGWQCDERIFSPMTWTKIKNCKECGQ